MGDVTWVVACTSTSRLELLLRWLPEQPWPWVKKILVVTPEWGRAFQRDIEFVTDVRPEWVIEVRDEAEESDTLDRIGAPEPLVAYFDDSLGVKLMLPLTVDTPFLYTDDDVVLTRDPSSIIQNYPWASHSGLDGYTDTPKDREALDTLCEAFLTEIPLDVFNHARTDAGVWYLPKFDLNFYLNALLRYFDSDHIRRVAADTGTAPKDHTQRFRKLDQRFLSGYMITHGGISIRAPHYKALADRKIPVKIPGSAFLHYCASGNKEGYMEWLRRAL